MTEPTPRAHLAPTHYFPPSPEQPEGFKVPHQTWVSKNPVASLALVGMAFTGLQWVSLNLLDEAQAPARKKTAALIRKIGRDIQTLAVFELEAERRTREFLGEMARSQNKSFQEPPELEDARKKAQKIRDR